MMKKIVALFLTAVLGVALSSCGGSKESAETSTENKQEYVEAATQEAQATGGFDNEIKLGTGESYLLSSPTEICT